MNPDQLEKLRRELIHGNSSMLAEIFKKHNQYCIHRLIKSRKCSKENAEDIFIEAILNFREKIISGKISEIKNLKGYLWGTCQNMHRRLQEKEIRKRKKANEISLLFGEKVDKYTDEAYKQMLKRVAVETLDSIGSKCQKLIRLFYVLNLSMAEIADEMNYANADVAKNIKKRCMKKWLEEVKKRLRKV